MEEKQTKFCSNCGAEIDIKAKICPKCGVEQELIPEKVSNWWYLVAVFFGIIGGLIAWVINKDKNPKKAVRLLLFGFILPAIWLLATIASVFLVTTTSFTSLDSAREIARDARRQSDLRQISTAMEIQYDYESGLYLQGISIADVKDDLESIFSVPQDPQGGDYGWIDNTKDGTTFCAYAKLEKGEFLVASSKGVNEVASEPRTLTDCERR